MATGITGHIIPLPETTTDTLLAGTMTTAGTTAGVTTAHAIGTGIAMIGTGSHCHATVVNTEILGTAGMVETLETPETIGMAGWSQSDRRSRVTGLARQSDPANPRQTSRTWCRYSRGSGSVLCGTANHLATTMSLRSKPRCRVSLRCPVSPGTNKLIRTS